MLKSAKEQEAWAQKLVDDASKRVQRAFEAGRSKAIIDQHREFLEEMKNALAKAKTETNTLQSKLRKLLQDT
jgi:flagellar biosynthesis/type III secretory pathway protein FliH